MQIELVETSEDKDYSRGLNGTLNLTSLASISLKNSTTTPEVTAHYLLSIQYIRLNSNEIEL